MILNILIVTLYLRLVSVIVSIFLYVMIVTIVSKFIVAATSLWVGLSIPFSQISFHHEISEDY